MCERSVCSNTLKTYILIYRGVGRRRPGADGSFASEDSAYKLVQLDLLLRKTLRTE